MQKRSGNLVSRPLQSRLAGVLVLVAALAGCTAPPSGVTNPLANRAPVAAAGPDITVNAWIPVRLNGMGTDADGDALAFWWTLLAPSGSVATLDDATSPTPTFTPDMPGDYSATLVVDDGADESTADVVAVTAEDHTTSAIISPAGGAVVSEDGALTFDVPPGALGADTRISLTPVARSQIAALGAELEERLGGVATPGAFRIWIGAADAPGSLLAPGSITWETDIDTEEEPTHVDVPEIMVSDGTDAEPAAEPHTEADLDAGTTSHTVRLGTGGFLAIVPNQLEITVAGLPEEAQVGDMFTATVRGRWLGEGAAPEQAEVGASADGAVRRSGPSMSSTRVDLTDGAFEVNYEFTCDAIGSGTVVLFAAAFRERGAPAEEGILPSTVVDTMPCVRAGGDEGITLGIHALEGMTDITAIVAIPARVGSVDNARADGAMVTAREGFQLRGLGDNRVIVDGLTTAPTQPIIGGLVVSRPSPGPSIPAAIFAFGTDFSGGSEPNGAWRFDYDPATESFSELPVKSPGAFWDAQTAGGMITDEIVAATNYGVDFFPWDGATWSHALDERLTLDRYGIARNLGIGSVAAGEAGGPLLVTVGYHRGDPGRLFFDDRGESGPVDIGELGVSPAMIRCALPLCFSVQARSNSVRTIGWDGATEPTIIGDPIPVGSDPGAVAVYRVTENLTLAAAFTGWTDHDVTLLEFDDDGLLLSSETMDLDALGCSGPRSGAWLPNPLEPDDPYLVIGCYNSNNYYVTKRFLF